MVFNTLCPGERPDGPLPGDGLPQGPAGRDEGGVAQPQRLQWPLRVGGDRQCARADRGAGQAAQPPLRGVSPQAAEPEVRGVSSERRGGGVQSEPVQPPGAQLHRVTHQPRQGTSLKETRKTLFMLFL